MRTLFGMALFGLGAYMLAQVGAFDVPTGLLGLPEHLAYLGRPTQTHELFPGMVVVGASAIVLLPDFFALIKYLAGF